MASITTELNGRKSIQFVALDGKKRPRIRLGKVSQRFAETAKDAIEDLLAAKREGRATSRHVSRWVAEVSEQNPNMARKLAHVGLIAPRDDASEETLAAFVDRYVKGRTDVKPATKEVWRQGKLGLIDYFGGSKALGSVTAGDADAYKLKLIGDGLAAMTVRKRLQFAKTVFRSALRHKLIGENPFADVTIKAGMPDRRHFIAPAETRRILAACNLQWQTIIALARYGGLRCPSEVLSLRWQDVDWEHSRIRVRSPKTEHHPGKASRLIPLFPELRPILEEAFEAAQEGAEYVVSGNYREACQGPAGWRNVNLRTQFERILERAGIDQWPRLFHNLRSSRQTELAESFPSHVVCAWLGNSEEIARDHYLQVTDEHYARGASAEKAAHNPAQ